LPSVIASGVTWRRYEWAMTDGGGDVTPEAMTYGSEVQSRACSRPYGNLHSL